VTRRAVAALRPLGGCLAAGLVAGIVIAGLGSRLVMRILAIGDPSAAGSLTETETGSVTSRSAGPSACSASSASRSASSPG
jgi:hypothetical protein